MLEVKRVKAAEVRPLRRAVLRPHQRPEELVYPDDDGPDTLHTAGYLDGLLVATASVYREPPPGGPDTNGWRLRGMAVLPEYRGKGYGAQLLEACIAHALERGGTQMWCNARSTAAGFYRALGFEAKGEEFDLPGIGAHYLMWRPLGPAH